MKTTMKEIFEAEADDIHEEIMSEVKGQPPLVPGKDGVMMPEMYAMYMTCCYMLSCLDI